MRRYCILSTCIAAALMSGQAAAQDMDNPDPYAKPDDSWISISGTVVSPGSDAFTLDYGDGVVIVEMDDWDAYGEAYGLLDGDKVTVYGRVDDDLFELATIEADSVYVENLNTYFYASSMDEEGVDYTGHFWTAPRPLVLSRATMRGTVSSVDRIDREFTIDTGLQQVTVETDELGYNPLDDLGYQQIDRGDRVSVSGHFDHDFIEGRVFEADIVITLSDNDNMNQSS